MKTKHCVRCGSPKTEPYGERILCTQCGFTFHRESTDEQAELKRRRDAGAK